MGKKKLTALGLTMIAALVPLQAAVASHVLTPVWEPRLSISSYDPVYLDLFPGGRGFALQFRSGAPDFTTERRSFLSVTTDFGQTWAEVPSAPGAYVADFATPTTGYAFTIDQAGRDILRTTDGAQTWTVLQDPHADLNGADSAGAYFDVMSAPSEDLVILGGVVSRYYADCVWESHLAVYRSDDGGATFTGLEFPYGGVVHQLEMLDDQHGVMLASEWIRTNNAEECSSEAESVRLRALATHDGGRSWEPFADEPFNFGAPPTDQGVHSVGIASADRLLLGMSNGDILTSHDRGTTFVRARGTANTINPPGDHHYLSRIEFMEFATSDVGYATSAHGAVWKTRDGGLTWRREGSVQASGDYSFSSGLAVANGRRAIVAAHTQLSSRVPRH